MVKKKNKKNKKINKDVKGQLGKKKRNSQRKDDWPNNWLQV